MKGTILLAGDGWYGSTVYSVAQGLRRLGWEIVEINPHHYLNICPSKPMRIINRVSRSFAIRDYNQSLIQKIKQVSPDAFLTIKGIYINNDTINFANKSGITTLNYYPDYHFSYSSFNFSTLYLYQAIFSTKSFQLKYLKEKFPNSIVSYLPHGYSNDVHFPRNIGKNAYINDLIYIGSYNLEKAERLEKIKARFPSYQFKIYGNGWDQISSNSILSPCINGNAIYGYHYCKMIQDSRINLAFHMGPVDKSGWRDLVSTRTFEIPACKGFMLHIDNEEVREFYEPEKEIGVFTDENDLFDKIDYYLCNEKLREEMIENAYQRCVPAYGYDARCMVISDYLEQQLSG